MNVILETALGLALVYLLVSMLASGMQEIIARYRGSRGGFLREGLLSLISDRWIYLRTINHPSIVAFYRYAPGKGHAPSYLPPETVAQALCDILVRRHLMLLPNGNVVFDIKAVKDAVRAAKDRNITLGHALLPIVESANTLEDAFTAIARWYEQSMDRVSGWYKTNAQKQLFFIGLIIAVAINIDSISIVEALARSPALRTEMAVAATQLERYQAEVDQLRTQPDAAAAPAVDKSSGSTQQDQLLDRRRQQIVDTRTRLDELAAAGLPIGYACLGTETQTTCIFPPVESWPLKFVGFLLTALAATLGAPFWFDLINRVISLRGSGTKPKAGRA